MIRWMAEEMPVGLDKVDRAWRHLREDRPHVDPVECSLTRALVQDQYDRLEDLRNEA